MITLTVWQFFFWVVLAIIIGVVIGLHIEIDDDDDYFDGGEG